MPAHQHHDQQHGHRRDHGPHPGHDHAHDHPANPRPRPALLIALILTTVFMIVEWITGLLATSLALLADATHMLTDAAALALALVAQHIALRPADARRSFGYQRLRVLATFINGCALMFIVAWIAIEAAQRFFSPATVDAQMILWVGTAGFAINLVVFAILRQGDAGDLNIAAATLHVLSDLLGSVAAVVAALGILWTGWMPLDPLLSLLVSVLIVRSAWSLIQRSAHILLEGAPDWLDVAELRATLEQGVPAIREVHHVHCWLVGPQEALLTLHATVAQSADHSSVLAAAKALLAEKFGIDHSTIQLEVEQCADVAQSCAVNAGPTPAVQRQP